MTDVSDGDVAVIVYREDETWDTEVLPTALTEDLNGLIHALRQQPSIGGTIGLVTVGDDFFVALRVIGGQVSVFLSDLTDPGRGRPRSGSPGRGHVHLRRPGH
jgi:putative tRNA adenosine deaminase-associated protein